MPVGATRRYGHEIVAKLVTWFWVALIPLKQRLLGLIMQNFSLTLCVCQWRSWPSQPGGWKDGATLPFLELRSVSFKKRARWFAKVLKEVLRHAGCSVPSGYVRPCSQMIAMHTGYLAVPWPVARLVQIGGLCMVPTNRTEGSPKTWTDCPCPLG